MSQLNNPLQKNSIHLNMKKIFFFLSLLTFGACSTLDIPENGTTSTVDISEKTMDQLTIPSTFTFETSQDITVNITANDNAGTRLKNVPFKLYAIEQDGQDSILLMTSQTNTEGVFQTKLNVTANIDRLIVTTEYIGLPQYQTVSVKSDNVSINIGSDNTKRNGFISEDKQGGFGGGGSSVDATFSYMGSYNALGVPLYLLPQGDVVSQDILNVVNASLPESRPVPQYHPEYIASNVQTNIVLNDSASIWVTFIHEGAGYRNSLGYYAYPTNNPPTTAAEVSQLKIVFPNVSFLNSGGGLKTGDKVLLGKFPAGTTIGWFLVPDGWTTPQKIVAEKSGLPMRYSNRNFNTFTTSSYRNHIALLADPARELILMGFEDLNRPNGDNDFNDAVFYVTASPFSAIQTTNVAQTTNYAPDADNDGIPDAQDAAPNDPSYAFVSYGPSANQYGTLAFEDAFPSKGDYDMNDVVVDYNFEERSNAAHKVTSVKATLILKAMGASYRNGFGFELPIAANKVASATGMKIKENIVNISGNGTESGQNKAVFIAFDNGYSLMSANGGGFVNTEKDKPLVKHDTIRMTINFTEGIEKSILGSAPYNPFIFVNKDRGREVHLPGKTPTTLANATYFKTGDDDSGNGKYYQTKKFLPWAINITQPFNYPIEKAPISTAFLKFNQWAESNGTQFIDWYQNKSNYRRAEKIY
jgi:LruC domain-containing protein